MNNRFDLNLLRHSLRRQEFTARSVPYISFILTHAALVIFFVLAFFLDRLVSTPQANLLIKILLVIIAVLLLASEWIYAFVNSRRWKKDIALLMRLEEEQRQREELEKNKRQEEIIAAEQMRNRLLQSDNQRLRHQQRESGPDTPQVRSVRPTQRNTSPQVQRNPPQYPFPPSPTERNPPHYPFPPSPAEKETPQYPFPQQQW